MRCRKREGRLAANPQDGNVVKHLDILDVFHAAPKSQNCWPLSENTKQSRAASRCDWP